MRVIRSIDDAIEAFGGNQAAAKRHGLVPHSISMWKARGQIPAEYILELVQMGFKVDVQALRNGKTRQS
jgi:hypothetical protein